MPLLFKHPLIIYICKLWIPRVFAATPQLPHVTSTATKRRWKQSEEAVNCSNISRVIYFIDVHCIFWSLCWCKILSFYYRFVNLGEIGSLENYFLFEHPRLQRRSTEESSDHTLMLLSEPEVKWAEQMVEKRRVKRDAKDRPLWVECRFSSKKITHK